MTGKSFARRAASVIASRCAILRYHLRPLAVACLMATPVIGGCQQAGPPSPPAPTESARDFTDEDRRVARVLSLGSESEAAIRTPFEEAAICEMALVKLQARISSSMTLDAAQRAGLERAREIFRARQAAADLPPAEQAAARKRVQESVIDEEYWGRVAIGCLRSLQQTGG